MRKHHLIWIREWTLRFIHIYTCMPEWSMLTWLAEQVVFTAALCELQNPLLHQLKQLNFMTLTYSDTQARLKQSIFWLINVFFCCNAEVQTKFLQIGSDCKNVFFVGLPFPTLFSDGGQGLCDVNECEQPADTYDCKCWSSILTTWV